MSLVKGQEKLGEIIYAFDGLADDGLLQVPKNSLIVIEKFVGNIPKYVLLLDNINDNDDVAGWFAVPSNYSEFCPKNLKPAVITNFAASDNLPNKIRFTWSNPEGATPITYNLFKNNVLLVPNIVSGFQYTITGTDQYYIQASNNFGSSLSNTNQGTGTPIVQEIPPSNPYLHIHEYSSAYRTYYRILFNQVQGSLPIYYDLYRNNILHKTSISTGYSFRKITGRYILIARNSYGDSQSNTVIKV